MSLKRKLRDSIALAKLPPKTVVEARTRLFKDSAFAAGSQCPCCDQTVKLYRRRLNAGMAAIICWLVTEHLATDGWVDVHAVGPRFALRSNEVSRLAHWSLVLSKPNQRDPSRRDSGLWRPTVSGVQFAQGTLSVPTHALIYNGVCRGMSEELFDVHAALLAGPFDYDELMRGNG